LGKLLAKISLWVGKLMLLGVIILSYMYFSLPDVRSLKQVSYQEPLQIFARDGQLIESFGKVHRIPIKIEDVPHYFIQALLVTEDQRFYEHPGIDIIGVGRALRELVSTGEKRQGASTITMQVARNFFLGREKTYFRKINEVLLALAIERSITKNEILELYLNKIYFGHRAYGIAAAARNYFSKSLDELTIAEMALLAGLPKSPSRNNPIDNLAYAVARRNLILGKMLDKDVITQEIFDIATQEVVVLKQETEVTLLNESGRYIADLTRQTMVNQFGDKAYELGLKVHTTIDADKQIAAVAALRNGLEANSKKSGWQKSRKHKNFWHLYDQHRQWAKAMRQNRVASNLQASMIVDTLDEWITIDTQKSTFCPMLSLSRECWLSKNWCSKDDEEKYQTLNLNRGDLIYLKKAHGQSNLIQIPEEQGALVALNSHTSEIEALTGGYLFSQSHFNRATQAYRQPGSAVKPLLYAAALEQGFTMSTIINDGPIVIEDAQGENATWRPKNVDHQFKGPIRLRQALIQSRNLVSVRLANALGIETVIEYFKNFGLDPEKQPNGLSISLGAGLVTPLQLAHAFTAFPNQGRLEPVKWISRVEDARGNPLLDEAGIRAAESTVLPQETQPGAQVLSPQTAYILSTGLRDVVRYGTGRGANRLNRTDIHGKTGTSNDLVDAWFAGYNPDLVVAVWAGYDDTNSKKSVGMGSKVALPIWVDFMHAVLRDDQKTIEEPDDIIRLRINRKTGLPATGDLSDSMFEVFTTKNYPKPITQTKQDSINEEQHTLRDEIF